MIPSLPLLLSGLFEDWEIRVMQKKRYHEFINQICAKLDGKIVRYNYPELNYIDRPGKYAIYWKVHGNKYVVWVEIMSQDQQAIEQIKQSFPEVF